MAACAAVSASAQIRCDPTLVPPAGTEHGYQRRGDRCEGLFTQNLSSGTELVVVGLMARSADFAFGAAGSVDVRWRPVAGESVRLQGHSTRLRTHYRMDALRPGATAAYRWPTSVLGPLQLRRAEISVLAWIDGPGNRRLRVHLPVRVDNAGARPAASYELTVVPETEFATVRATLRRRGPDGTWQTVGTPSRDLGRGSYPARHPFPVSIPLRGTLEPGEYELELTGRRAAGGMTTTPFRFRHGPEPL